MDEDMSEHNWYKEADKGSEEEKVKPSLIGPVIPLTDEELI